MKQNVKERDESELKEGGRRVNQEKRVTERKGKIRTGGGGVSRVGGVRRAR